MILRNIRKSYGAQVVFDGLDLDIEEGKILCIVGASGVGKTTLLNALAGLTKVDGETVGVPKKVAYAFQEPRLLPALSVRENLLITGGEKKAVEEMLAVVGLTAHAEKRPSELSGGEKQRAAIARAFLSDSPLLLMDEPFSALDTALKIRLTELFVKLWERTGKTVVFVTHDLEDALKVGHRTVALGVGGKILCDCVLEGDALPRGVDENAAARETLTKALLERETV